MCEGRLTVESVLKVFCVVLLVLQSCILDYYLVENDSLAWIGFVLIDIVIILLWIAALFIAFKQHQRETHEASTAMTSSLDELRIAYVAWLVYATGYTIQISFIFKTFAHKLDNAKTASIFGQNMLKLSLTLTPMLFLLLVHAHHDAAPNSSRKYYIERLTGGVTIDLMDSIEILEIFFMEPTETKLPTSFENVIVAFACINVFLPTVALHALKQKKLWQSALLPSKVLYNLCYIFLVNVPFFVIRVILWASYGQDVSVFLAKNVILIVMNSWDVAQHYSHHSRSSMITSPDLVLEDIPSDTGPSAESSQKNERSTSGNTSNIGGNITEKASLNENEELSVGYV